MRFRVVEDKNSFTNPYKVEIVDGNESLKINSFSDENSAMRYLKGIQQRKKIPPQHLYGARSRVVIYEAEIEGVE